MAWSGGSGGSLDSGSVFSLDMGGSVFKLGSEFSLDMGGSDFSLDMGGSDVSLDMCGSLLFGGSDGFKRVCRSSSKS